MKKRIFSLLLIAALMLCLGATAYAMEIEASSGWAVTYDGRSLTNNFNSVELVEETQQLQPGDNIIFRISISNASAKNADFWMANAITKSFESVSGSGGAYTYTLSYNGEAIYDNAAVGGTIDTTNSRAPQGLEAATSSLQDYFYVDTLKSGESGEIVLTIGLDGETIRNDYRATLADLTMNFGVEDSAAEATRRGNGFVRTGDENQIMPWLLVSAFSGLALLVIVIIRLSKSRKAKSEQ